MEPIENGNHHGVCVAVIDIGTQYNATFNKSQPKVVITWELPDFPMSRDSGELTYRLISKEYTASLHEKANLYCDLVSWRGRDFTPEELTSFKIKQVLGANCLVNVVRTTKGNRTYANVTAVAKLPKSMVAKTATYQFFYDMDEGIIPIPDGVPDWIKNKIVASQEYIAEVGGQANAPDDSPAYSDEEPIPF